MRKKWFFIVPAAIVGIALFITLGGGVVQYLWNWLLPSMFGLRQITFWEALGILALCRILFGGFGMHGSRRSGPSRRMAERWQQMSPEEQERFRQGIRGRCGFGPQGAETKV